MYSVYFKNEYGKWEILLKGLSEQGAKRHARMYADLFQTETKIVEWN
jgi:hypothetical protein